MSACERDGCQGTYRPDDSCSECGYARSGTVGPGEIPIQQPEREKLQSASTPGHPTNGTAPGWGRSTPSQGRLVAGLVEIASVVARDPASAVLPDPRVPLPRQVCRRCGEPVGQARGGQPGLSEGFCPKDGTPFSFAPRLATGDLVDNRYEVLGCLAYGGFGWIYLARDARTSDQVAERRVVLKGLIDTSDPDAVGAVLNERRFLVEVDYPNIVKIYDFVQHPDPRTDTMVGYIVMEYLGGQSLQSLYLRHRHENGQRAPLPLTTVLAYGLEVLQAFTYLHEEKNAVYCDLKPDNIMHVGHQVKLIDLGAVRRIGNRSSAWYGTPGFQAPEVERRDGPEPPSVASDIYTVGRTLAVLSLIFEGFTTRYRHQLPDPAQTPLLAREKSFHRLLLRATHREPDQRFESAQAMYEQMHGVLAEVLANQDGGRPRQVTSTRFTPERRAFGASAHAGADPGAYREVDWATLPDALPVPLMPDLSDPNAAFLATVRAADPRELVEALLARPVRSPEVVLRLVEARITAGDVECAADDLAEFEAVAPLDWRALWYRGVASLAGNNPDAAREAFDAVYSRLPGEMAPKLALAASAEWAGDDERAGTLYDRIWRTDTQYVSAAFGLARVRQRRGRPTDVIKALDGIPDTSSRYLDAQVAAILARLGSARLAKSDLLDAEGRLRRLKMDAQRNAALSVEVLSRALDWIRAEAEEDRSGTVLGRKLDERELRLGLEKFYRTLAKLADDRKTRYRLVDQANEVRPMTPV